MNDASDAAADAATVLAFDFGTRRIGVAVGNTLLRVAQPLGTIGAERNIIRFAIIAEAIDKWKPARLVVGLPTHADGTEHEMTALARRFAHQLEVRHRLPVDLVDERWTTEVAIDMLAAQGKRGSAARAERDQVAAQIILQAWFDDPVHR